MHLKQSTTAHKGSFYVAQLAQANLAENGYGISFAKGETHKIIVYKKFYI